MNQCLFKMLTFESILKHGCKCFFFLNQDPYSWLFFNREDLFVINEGGLMVSVQSLVIATDMYSTTGQTT